MQWRHHLLRHRSGCPSLRAPRFFTLKLEEVLVDGFPTSRVPPKQLLLPLPHEEPFYGIAVERILDLDDGSRIYFGDAETGVGLVHVGSDGSSFA
eukprot:Skav211965  [mRNA]  locus=scaffold433:301400:317262:- [translate_table: standard]